MEEDYVKKEEQKKGKTKISSMWHFGWQIVAEKHLTQYFRLDLSHYQTLLSRPSHLQSCNT